MVIKNYLCSKCGSLVEGKQMPPGMGCLTNGNFHRWRDIGEKGDKGFHCEGCSTVVHSKETPSMFGCPGEGFHNWKDLK